MLIWEGELERFFVFLYPASDLVTYFYSSLYLKREFPWVPQAVVSDSESVSIFCGLIFFCFCLFFSFFTFFCFLVMNLKIQVLKIEKVLKLKAEEWFEMIEKLAAWLSQFV